MSIKNEHTYKPTAYCDKCSKFCTLSTAIDFGTLTFRPVINGQIIYDYTPTGSSTPQIQLYWDNSLALRKAREIAENCKHRTR